MFKLLHEVLPTKKRLKQMKKIQNSECSYCLQEESSIHLIYLCPMVKGVAAWLRNLLQKICNLNNINLMKLMFLDIPKVGKKERNVCLLLITTYILSLWNLKDNRANKQLLIKHIKGKILQKILYMKYAMGDKYSELVTREFSNLSWNDI